MAEENKEPERATSFQSRRDYGFRSLTIQQKAAYVLRHFNSIALKYDFMNSVLSFGIHHIWKRRAVSSMNLQRGSRVLDVCGGTGDLAILASKSAGGSGSVIIYDINRSMMDRARIKIASVSVPARIKLVQGDAETLSFPNNCFDAAMVGFGVRNLTDMEKGLSEMSRVLKPGGTMMCLEFSVPVAPWFRMLYDFYSFTVMPLAGRVLAGRSEPYCYLPVTIRNFPAPDLFSAMIARSGFTRVSYERLTNGIAVIYTGVKP